MPVEGYRQEFTQIHNQAITERSNFVKKLLHDRNPNLDIEKYEKLNLAIINLKSQLTQLDSFKLADNKIKKIEGSTSYKIGLFLEKKGSFFTAFFRKMTGTKTETELKMLKNKQNEELKSFGEKFREVTESNKDSLPVKLKENKTRILPNDSDGQVAQSSKPKPPTKSKPIEENYPQSLNNSLSYRTQAKKPSKTMPSSAPPKSSAQGTKPTSSSKQKIDAQLQSEAKKADYKAVHNKIRRTSPPSSTG